MLDRIKVDPAVSNGRPTIRGLRITVDFVLKLLGDGYSASEIVDLYCVPKDAHVFTVGLTVACFEHELVTKTSKLGS